jgi:hypothetical protein
LLALFNANAHYRLHQQPTWRANGDEQMKRFAIAYRVTGRIDTTIEAADETAARCAAEAESDNDDFVSDLHDIDDVRIDVRELHPVTRDGKPVWTTYPLKSDVPGHHAETSLPA